MQPWWSWAWMLIWVAALLVAVWLVVRAPSQGPAPDDAVAILRARFARGELTADEFERALRLLDTTTDQSQRSLR